MSIILDEFLGYLGYGNNNCYIDQVFAKYQYRVPANIGDDNRVIQFSRYMGNTDTGKPLNARVIAMPEDRIVAYVENRQIFVASEGIFGIFFRFFEWHTPISQYPLATQNRLMREIREEKRKVEVQWESGDQQGNNERVIRVVI